MRPTNILILIASFAITFGADWTDTTWEENPFMVQVRRHTESTHELSAIGCGGSIVYKGNDNDDAVILTAAHCVAGALNVDVLVGCTKTNCSDDHLSYTTKNYIVHPQYDSSIHYSNNDIALVYVANASNISNSGASQVTLHSNINILQNNAEITIFGYWGLCERSCVGGSDTDSLEYAITNYMITTECDDIWGE
eukprot:249560_1